MYTNPSLKLWHVDVCITCTATLALVVVKSVVSESISSSSLWTQVGP